MGRPLIQPPIKNKLLLWNVFVKWCSDGWTSVYPLAGRWEPPQRAAAKACGEDLLSNCGWEGGGVSMQLFNMKGDHFSTCFRFPIMLYCKRIFCPYEMTAEQMRRATADKNSAI